MTKKANSKEKRRNAGSVSSEKRIVNMTRVVDPNAGIEKCITTAGESLPGAMIELTANSPHYGGLNLLLWNGSKGTVGPRIRYGGFSYEPIVLDPTVRIAVAWPRFPIEYQSTTSLFERVLKLLKQHLPIQERDARLLTYFVFSTWFPERLSLSPSVAVLGPTDCEGIQLLRLLRCMCRRSMLLADPSPASLLSLPLNLSPTLLINRPIATRQLRNFLSTSNRRGLGKVKRGKMMEVCCPKAINFGMDPIPQEMAAVMIRIALSSSSTPTTVLEDGPLNDIAAELQGKMLAYRLANYPRVQATHFRGTNLTPQTQEIAMNLAACILDDSELASGVADLLRQQDDHVRGQPDRKLDAAILGAVLACLHEKKSNRVQVKEVTALANTLLRIQGEIVEYIPEEVGHRLDGFSLWRTRQKEGMFLSLGRDTSRLVHRLALGLGVAWDVDSAVGCADCELLESPAESSLV